MNVLIVDDDKLARKGLVAIMDWKKYGFEHVLSARAILKST